MSKKNPDEEEEEGDRKYEPSVSMKILRFAATQFQVSSKLHAACSHRITTAGPRAGAVRRRVQPFSTQREWLRGRTLPGQPTVIREDAETSRK